MAKIPQMIYFDEEIFVRLFNYKKEKHVQNISQAINLLIPEYFKFKVIALKLQEEMNKQAVKIEEIEKEVKNDTDKNK